MSQPQCFPRLSVILVAATLAFAGAPASAQTSKEKAARFYEDALTRFDKKDITGTIIQLKNALQADKTLLPVQLLLGRALMMDGQAVAAEVAITEALRLGVDRAEVVVTLGEALSAQGKQQALLEHPALAPAGLPAGVRYRLLLLRASAMADLGDTSGALKALTEARSADRNAPESWTAEVPIRLRNQQWAEANAAADTAVKLAPDSAEAHYQRATIAHLKADVKLALTDYAKALSLDAGHLEARLAHAGLLIDTGKDAEAKVDLDEARKRFPKDPRAAYLSAILHDRKGDRVASKAALGEVVALIDPVPLEFIRFRPQFLLLNGLAHYGLSEPSKAKPYLEMFQRAQPGTPVGKLLAQIYMQEDAPDKAIEVLESYLRSSPGDGSALVQLARVQIAKGRSARAAQLMQDALKAKDSPQFHSVLGLALSQSGDAAGARRELSAAFDKNPGLIQAGTALIALNLKEGRAAEAVTLATRLLKQFPNDAALTNLAGVAKAEAGDYGGARRAFENALVLDKTAMQPQLGLARVDIATGAFDSANSRLRALLKADERNVEAVYDMAVLQDRMNRPEDAQRWLERAAELSSKTDTRADYALVEFHLRKGKPAEALSAAKTLLGKTPEDVKALVTHGRALLATGNTAGAQQAFVNAGRRAGFDANTLAGIAQYQLAAGDLSGAAYTLEKALGHDPAHLPANQLMASIELRRNELAQAEARARRIIQQYPKFPGGHQLLGDVASARNQGPAAIAAYREAHRLQPSTATAVPLLRLLSIQAQGSDARALATEWLKTHPSDLAFRKAYADHLARAGDFARARHEYEAALKLAPDDAEALNNLANILLALKDTRAAVNAAEQAVARSPTQAIYADTLGWALFQDGKVEASLLKLRDARLRLPKHPEIRYHLAVVLAKTGKIAEAREELSVALKEHPAFESRSAASALLQTLK